MRSKLLSKEQVHVISVVTFGSILEWFDVYSFAYFAPVLAKKFFPTHTYGEGLFFSFLVFGLGFVTRPFGGIIFGWIGDHQGRKKAFLLSIIFLTIPTFCMGVLPTYETWGMFAVAALFILRLAQSIPTGGELPGTICYLYENSESHNKRFITSWNAVGNQIGAIVAIIECFLIDNYLPTEIKLNWGWRISFITGGVIGLFGIYLRYTLHETPVFKRLIELNRINKETISNLLYNHRSKIYIGTAFGVVDAATFYLVATYVPSYVSGILKFTTNQSLLISFLILTIVTILLPVFGYIADKISNKAICIGSALMVILLLYPLAIAIDSQNIYWLGILGFLFLLPIVSITALIAYLLGSLFPAPVRFTGTGMAMNLADGIIGGFTPAISILLVWLTGNQSAFCWYIFLCAIISLFAYSRYIKD